VPEQAHRRRDQGHPNQRDVEQHRDAHFRPLLAIAGLLGADDLDLLKLLGLVYVRGDAEQAGALLEAVLAAVISLPKSNGSLV